MIWPEVGNIVVVARRGEYNGFGQKRVIKLMWPEEGNLTDVARRGEYK